ncbi:MAG: NAD(P)/FAD-dependent oxidoreductase [Oscillospiraceae bacterium]|nr:NAD(P)/FAD-dependent oxidoreductase [Oscillospiraceae bacterium]
MAKTNPHYNFLIIGAGAAGLMAGIIAARRGLSVALLEKMERPGRKLLITGKGRCNVCNCCTIEEFLPNVMSNPRFLYSCLNNFNPYEVMGFFEELGVPLKVERGQRVFPESDRSMDVVDALVDECKKLGCKFIQGTAKELLLEENCAKGAVTADGCTLKADAVLIATGGKSYPATGSTGDGYALAMQAGHTITKLKPSLVPIVTNEAYCRDMMGLSLKNVVLTVTDSKNGKIAYSELGEMLFTHFGVSGPLVLSASCCMNGDLSRYRMEIDLKPALSEEQLDARLLRDFEQFKNKAFGNSLSLLLPRKMIPVVVKLSGIPAEQKVNQITREQRQKLIQVIKAFPISAKCFRPIEEAIVTAGGVSVSEVSPKTMESKKCKDLYFAGEVLDVDAYTGGYNLQIAFSTAFAAASYCCTE